MRRSDASESPHKKLLQVVAAVVLWPLRNLGKHLPLGG